jgi:hypothetical protein
MKGMYYYFLVYHRPTLWYNVINNTHIMMKFRNLSIIAVLVCALAIILYGFAGVSPYLKGDITLSPSQLQVIDYNDRLKPWTAVCRSGEQTYCNGFGICDPSRSSTEDTAIFRVQQCIDNLRVACVEGNYSSTTIEVNTETLDVPWSGSYSLIYYASNTVTCEDSPT